MTATLPQPAPVFTPPPDTDTLIWRPGPCIDWENAPDHEHQAVWDYFESKKTFHTWSELLPHIDRARTYREFIALLIHARQLSYLHQPYYWKSYIYEEAQARGIVLPSRIPKSFERK